jgi:hypothetical protein
MPDPASTTRRTLVLRWVPPEHGMAWFRQVLLAPEESQSEQRLYANLT